MLQTKTKRSFVVYIETKYLNSRSGTLFIFNFRNRDEFEALMHEWKKHTVDFASDDDVKQWVKVLNALSERITDKYATNYFELTSSLFTNEFVVFTQMASSLLALSMTHEYMVEIKHEIKELTQGIEEFAEAAGISLDADDESVLGKFRKD